jgi:hypothetical protein
MKVLPFKKQQQSILTTTTCQAAITAKPIFGISERIKNVKIKHTNLYILCTSSAIKLNWLLLHKLAVQLLINTNKGFMHKTKTESICFTNRNSEGIEILYKFLNEFFKDSASTNSLRILLSSAKI